MVTFGMNEDAVAAHLFSAYSISTDGGTNWSHGYLMGDETHDSGGWSAAPEKDGAIWHLYTPLEPHPANQTQRFHITLSKFWRGGREISIDRDVVLNLAEPMFMVSYENLDELQKDFTRSKEEPSGFPFGPILHARNGDLITPIYYKTKRDPRYYRLGMIRSSDEGKTWNEYSTIAALKSGEPPWPWLDKDGPCEAGMVRLADGRLYVIYRTGSDGYMGKAWSNDDGQTWTSPSHLPFKGVSPRMRRLGNGVLACTFGRPGPVSIMFSLDGTGEKWDHVTTIFSGRSTHYNDFIEISPEKILLVYDNAPHWHDYHPETDRNAKETVFGTFIEVNLKH